MMRLLYEHSGWLYPLLILIALGMGLVLRKRFRPEVALEPLERWGILMGAFCGAMIGAKLPFVIADWEGLRSGAAWFASGKTIVLGLVGGYLGVETAKWLLHVRVKTGDSFAVPVAATVAIGRLGCFVGGCCYGTPTSLPWGVVFPRAGNMARHPTQLYEATFHAVAAVVLWQLYRRRIFPGQLIKLYILAYLAYRVFSEWIRPEAVVWGPLTGYQVACLALMPVFAWLWVRDARQISAASGQNNTPLSGIVAEDVPP